MKRRKNSSTSSSSMPGTCGAAPGRRTACVVLMFTTALPWSSTRRVKSGSSRTACAAASVETRTSQTAVAALAAFIFCSPKALLFQCSLRLAVLDCVGDALHAARGRFTNYRNHVIRNLSSIDVDRAHAGQAGAHRLAAPFHRFDEHRDRGKAVGIDHLAGGARLPQAPLQFGN